MHRKLLFRILITFIFISATLPVDIAYSQTLFLTPEYMGNIQQRMYSCLVYPQEAKDKGWEGIVKVRFALAQDGRVKSIDIAESPQVLGWKKAKGACSTYRTEFLAIPRSPEGLRNIFQNKKIELFCYCHDLIHVT